METKQTATDNTSHTGTIYGYVRVSSKDQNPIRQIEAILKEDVNGRKVSKENIYMDKASGKDFDRVKYSYLKSILKEGDIVIVTELDRLGRNWDAMGEEWKYFADKGVGMIIIDTPLLNTVNAKGDIDTKFISKMVLELMSYIAQKEREKIKQRQREGIASARSRGVIFGRPKLKTPQDFNFVYNQWKSGEITAVKAMDKLNLKKSSFYNLVRIHEAKLNNKKE